MILNIKNLYPYQIKDTLKIVLLNNKYFMNIFFLSWDRYIIHKVTLLALNFSSLNYLICGHINEGYLHPISILWYITKEAIFVLKFTIINHSIPCYWDLSISSLTLVIIQFRVCLEYHLHIHYIRKKNLVINSNDAETTSCYFW